MTFIQKQIKNWVDKHAISTCNLSDKEWSTSLSKIYSLDPIKHTMIMFKTTVLMARSIWFRTSDGFFICLGQMAWGFSGWNYEYGIMTLSQHRIEFCRTSGNTSEWFLDKKILLGSVCMTKWWFRLLNFPIITPFQITYPNIRKGVLKPPTGLLLSLGRNRKPLLGVMEFDDGISVKFKFRSRTDGVYFKNKTFYSSYPFLMHPTQLSTPTFSVTTDLKEFAFEEKVFLIGLALWPRIFYPINGEDPCLFKDEKIELE